MPLPHRLRRFIFFIVAALSFTPALAAEEKSPTVFLSEETLAPNRDTITRLETYLSNITSIVSDFTQIAPDGSLTSGKFFLQRPGKMRWQYNPPTPVLIVADGKTLVFFDYELEQVNYIPLDSTLIGFLAQPTIRFDGLVGVTEFKKDASAIRITVTQRDKQEDGSLMLEFSDRPLQLRNMVITDTTHQVTTVSLNNAQFGVVLDKSLFVFKDPRKPRTRP